LTEAAFIVFYTAPEIEVTPEILNIVAVNVTEVQFGSGTGVLYLHYRRI
jgi:hypothetical protein